MQIVLGEDYDEANDDIVKDTPMDQRKSPCPNLEEGGKVPRRYGKLPEGLTNVPLCDIDPYYEDKSTFIVIKRDRKILRYSASSSLFLFSPFHSCRRLALFASNHWFFNFFVMITILANCYILTRLSSPHTKALDILFTSVYTFEATVKICARGLIIGEYERLHMLCSTVTKYYEI